MQGKTHADFILKIVGFNDAVDGHEMMLDHEFLMYILLLGVLLAELTSIVPSTGSRGLFL